jgi:hypothetical protein
MTAAASSNSGTPGDSHRNNNGNNTPVTTPSEHAFGTATTTNDNNNLASNVSSARARADSVAPPPATPMRGPIVKKADRILIAGKADLDQCDNQVISARYTIYSFFPLVRYKCSLSFVSLVVSSMNIVEASQSLFCTL